MAAVRKHGSPVDDPGRVGQVRHELRVDETTFLAATKEHPTLFATGLVDLERRVVIDAVEGGSGQDLGSWVERRPEAWLC
jgi:hypothetical protein